MAEKPGSFRWSGWLDWLYPGVCRLCGDAVAGGGSVCGACARSIPEVREPFCSTCSEGFEGRIDAVFDCPNCRDQTFAFDFARAGVQRSQAGMELVHQFKYGRCIDLARDLAGLALKAFSDPRLQPALEERWPLVPVPLHWRRRGWRRFNQALEIARPLGRELGLPVVAALKRVRATRTQTRLSRKERQRNLRGAFRLAAAVDAWRGAVLIDDVFTTGSTVNECARVLTQAGVQKVVVVTVMRG
ncbi:ComF family protein [Haloferula sargassicola]|uniref:Double zinc ribbon domain-containing protein n=1 Tax=Haloferula sargassicola TaxID=490096 RepID=A0ABP9UQP3_9BACT